MTGTPGSIVLKILLFWSSCRGSVVNAWIPRCCGSGVGLAAIAPIRPLAWELPYAAEVAQEMAKRQKKKKVLLF